MVDLRTTTMLMGLAGPGQWRTSTLSTKHHRAGFSHVSEVTWDTVLVMRTVQITGSPTVLFVCFYFKAISCFSDLRREVVSSVSSLINPSGSASSLQTQLSRMSVNKETKRPHEETEIVKMERKMKHRCRNTTW